jgi:hypothetical protein
MNFQGIVSFISQEIKKKMNFQGIVSFISTFTYSSDVSGLTGLPIKLYFTGPGV